MLLMLLHHPASGAWSSLRDDSQDLIHHSECFQDMARRMADLVVLFTPANLEDAAAPDRGADCVAAQRMAERVGWDCNAAMHIQQFRIHDIWRSFMRVPKLPDDWRYFAQRGCFALCIRDYTSKARAAVSRESLPICKMEALRGEPAAGLPDSRPYTHTLSEQEHYTYFLSDQKQWQRRSVAAQP